MKRLPLILYLVILSCSISPLYASALKRIYNNFEGNSNYTSPGGFQDQSAGYYTGGGFVLRQSNPPTPSIQISLPKDSVGCNHMDLFFGSLSFIKGEELTRLGKAVLTGVPTYALQLALKTASPQIEGLLSEIRERVLAMNELMQNSCQMSQKIVGGLWPKNTAASEQICQDVSRSGGTDFFGARKHCQKDKDISDKIEAAKAKFPDLMAGEYNLVWYVMKKMPAYSGDKILKEFIMSLVGTITSVKDGERYRVRYMTPKADSVQFLAAYLKGGLANGLKCDEDHKCLNPTVQQIEIVEGLKKQVSDHITVLRQKYIANGALDAKELAFLSDSVTVPVYKYIQVSVASGSDVLTADATEYIAIAVLLYQFETIMTEILEAVELLEKVQLDTAPLKEFKNTLLGSRNNISKLQNAATMQAKWMLNKMIEAEEQATIARNM